MKKKGMIIIAAVLFLVVFWAALYPVMKRGSVQKAVEDYIVAQGYPVESIKDTEVEHSYLNKALGFDEWRIFSVFEKEPDVAFCFSYRNGEILFHGVRSEPLLPKDKVIEYSEKFKDGTLLED